ncbi:MAG: YggS family pyridoxal phosphate-dependent enzyme [Pseudomonadota bacterium]
MGQVAENIADVRRRIEAACQRAGRDPAEVTLVGASKTVGAAGLAEAMEAGLGVFGENYVQEAKGKVGQPPGAVWHLIGRLQTNKAALAVRLFALIHTLDSLRLALDLDRRAAALGKVQPVLIEVRLVPGAGRAGVPEADLPELASRVASLPNLDPRGLMCLPPFFEEPERARPYFAQLREARDRLRRATGLALPELSMGMSGDFETAIEEGATLVRVGTAIFGRRPARG